MISIESEFPRGQQRLYQALRDAGISKARALRNVEWINVADDGITVLNLWRRYITLKNDNFVAEVDAREWVRDGIGANKTRRVIDGLVAMTGKRIRCVILEENQKKRRNTVGARLDPLFWKVQDSGADFVLRRETATEAAFTQRMLKIYDDAKAGFGYRATRFKPKVERDGGMDAAKYWLQPSADTTDGFARLLAHGRLDLSVEAVALEPRWAQLFTAAELSTASSRLEQVGYFDIAPPDSEFHGPDEVPSDAAFDEGLKKTVQVNAYERDPRARDLCVRHYGAVCHVCGFDFEKAYGDLGRGYIHVHHLNPLAAAQGSVKTDPVRDLRPVCANCHSIIHRRRHALPIETLQSVLEVQRKRNRAN